MDACLAVGEFTLQECTRMVASNNAASPMGLLVWVLVLVGAAVLASHIARLNFEKKKRRIEGYDPRAGLEPWE